MTRSRNTGVELLRLFSMLLVLMLHILGQGGVLAAAAPLSRTYAAAWLLETAAYCAVDCYALLSGYVSVTSGSRSARLVRVWMQVAFYTLSVTAVFFLSRPEMRSARLVVNAVFPVLTRQYWYVTAYFGLFLFLPYINRLLLTLERAALRRLAATVFLVFSVLPVLSARDLFQTSWGYSFLWLAALYVLGACLRLSDAGERWPKSRFLLLYALCVVLAWGGKLTLDILWPARAAAAGGLIVGYTSPPILLSAVCLLLFFSRLRVPPAAARLLLPLASASFGVYLIHTQPLIWNSLLAGRFTGFGGMGAAALTVSVPGAAAGIYLACAAAELLRQRLFRLLHLDVLAERLGRIPAAK